MSETAKAYRFGEAPKRIELRGDKTTATESAQHIITFPGGAIELARVGDDEYWVHERRASYRPAGEVINTREHEVVEMSDDARPKGFIVEHHYSGTYPAAERLASLPYPKTLEAA